MAKQHNVQAEEDTRDERGEISPIIIQLELADKEKAHPANAKDDRYEVAPLKFFSNDEGSKDQDIYRCCVLKKDCVRGRGMLSRPDKKKEQNGIDDGSYCAKSIYL